MKTISGHDHQSTHHFLSVDSVISLFMVLLGLAAFYLLLAKFEPINYFGIDSSSDRNWQLSDPDSRNTALNFPTFEEKKWTNVPADNKNLVPTALKSDSISNNFTLEDVDKKYAPVPLGVDSSAILSAKRDYLEKNTQRNNSLLKTLSTETEMHVFQFGRGHSLLDTQRLHQELDSTLGKCLDHPESYGRILILGFTDNCGDTLSNVKLGILRANVLKTYLLRYGIPAEKIKIASFGPDLPIASNSQEEGRAKNKRVELSILSNAQ